MRSTGIVRSPPRRESTRRAWRSQATRKASETFAASSARVVSNTARLAVARGHRLSDEQERCDGTYG